MDAKRARVWAEFSMNVADWFGQRVRWDPTSREIKQKVFALRSFKFTNEEKTKVCHQNTINMPDGKETMSKQYKFTPDANVLDDGFLHPAGDTARTLFQENGSFAFVHVVPSEVTKFLCEIGTCYKPECRFTDGFMYDESGKLSTISLWREQSEREPEKPFWSTDDQMKDGWQVPIPDEKFTGAERIVKTNLDVEIVPNCSWDRDYWSPREGKENDLHFLPENVTLSCPGDITGRTEFHISVCWINNSGQELEIRQHTVYYRDGRLSYFRQGIYRPEKA